MSITWKGINHTVEGLFRLPRTVLKLFSRVLTPGSALVPQAPHESEQVPIEPVEAPVEDSDDHLSEEHGLSMIMRRQCDRSQVHPSHLFQSEVEVAYERVRVMNFSLPRMTA